MTNTEYIARVIHHYMSHEVKLGYLSYNKNVNRFVICNDKGKKIDIQPDGCIHCGDTYIVKDNDGAWRIAQCEKTEDGLWKMLGTEITEKNCENNQILYIKNYRLPRFIPDFIDKSFKLNELSNDFIFDILR